MRPAEYRPFRRWAAVFRNALSRVPKRGRGRFFLALILAFAGYKIAGVLLSPHTAHGRTAHRATAPAFATAADFFPHRQPRLSSDRDTFDAGGRTLVAFYSIDTALQHDIRRMFRRYRPKYGAAVVMEPHTGRVLALVSFRHDGTPDLGGRLYLRGIFPAASIFKTVTAAAAIETAQYSGRTMIPVTGRSHTLYKYQLKKSDNSWNEKSFEDAFAHSINPIFGRIGIFDVGRKSFEDYSRRFGFNTPIPFDLAVDTSRVAVPDDSSYALAELASGFNRKTTLSPLHGALIAAAVLQDGRMPVPHVVDSVCGLDNDTCLFRMKTAVWKTAVSAATASELRNLMKKVVKTGTCRTSFSVLRRCGWSAALDYGGKSGSLDVDSLGKIDWFIGFAAAENSDGRRLALAVVTVHGRFWTVHSAFLGAEIVRKRFRPVLHRTKQCGRPVSPYEQTDRRGEG